MREGRWSVVGGGGVEKRCANLRVASKRRGFGELAEELRERSQGGEAGAVSPSLLLFPSECTCTCTREHAGPQERRTFINSPIPPPQTSAASHTHADTQTHARELHCTRSRRGDALEDITRSLQRSYPLIYGCLIYRNIKRA